MILLYGGCWIKLKPEKQLEYEIHLDSPNASETNFSLRSWKMLRKSLKNYCLMKGRENLVQHWRALWNCKFAKCTCTSVQSCIRCTCSLLLALKYIKVADSSLNVTQRVRWHLIWTSIFLRTLALWHCSDADLDVRWASSTATLHQRQSLPRGCHFKGRSRRVAFTSASARFESATQPEFVTITSPVRDHATRKTNVMSAQRRTGLFQACQRATLRSNALASVARYCWTNACNSEPSQSHCLVIIMPAFCLQWHFTFWHLRFFTRDRHPTSYSAHDLCK